MGFLFKTRINRDLNGYAKFFSYSFTWVGHQPSLTKHNGKEEKEQIPKERAKIGVNTVYACKDVIA